MKEVKLKPCPWYIRLILLFKKSCFSSDVSDDGISVIRFKRFNGGMYVLNTTWNRRADSGKGEHEKAK